MKRLSYAFSASINKKIIELWDTPGCRFRCNGKKGLILSCTTSICTLCQRFHRRHSYIKQVRVHSKGIKMDELDLNDFSFGDLDGFGGDASHFFNEVLSTEDIGFSTGQSTPNSFHISAVSSSNTTSSQGKDINSSLKRKVDDLELQQQLYKLPRPRAVKSDTRRAFPNIWANVFNSASYEYMMRHIEDFCDGNVSVLERDLRLSKFSV